MDYKKAVDLLRLLKPENKSPGLHIVKIVTVNPVTLQFEGTPLALDTDVFEIPSAFFPLELNDRFLCYPMLSSDSGRWGLVQKLN